MAWHTIISQRFAGPLCPNRIWRSGCHWKERPLHCAMMQLGQKSKFTNSYKFGQANHGTHRRCFSLAHVVEVQHTLPRWKTLKFLRKWTDFHTKKGGLDCPILQAVNDRPAQIFEFPSFKAFQQTKCQQSLEVNKKLVKHRVRAWTEELQSQ